MVTMPDGYAPYPDVRRVELTFSFGVVAPDAAALAVPASSAQSEVSAIGQTLDDVEEMGGKYGGLERSMWVLDGSMRFYPAPSGDAQTGWNSAGISGDDGAYTAAPWLEFAFPSNQSSFGFTLVFDDTQPQDHPATVVTTAYDADGALLGSLTSHPDGPRHVADLSVQGYRRVRFTFPATALPHRRVRVCGVKFGIEYTYGPDTIKGVEVRQSISPWAESLPSAEVTATVDNADQLYNMINPTGLYAYLQDGQYMDWSILIGGAKVYMGRRYFTAAESEDGGLTASLTFHDRLLVLDDVQYTGTETGTWTLQTAVTTLLTASGTGLTAVFEAGLASVVVGRPDAGTTLREALRQVAQAAMCTCCVDRSDRLHFVRPALATAPVSEWGLDVQHGPAQVKVGQLYNVVKLVTVDETVYWARNVATDDIERVYEVSNPCVTAALGASVAAWVLGWVQRRVTYEVTTRGDPAVDLLDTVRICDVYGVDGDALVTQLDYSYDGGLTCDAAAIR